MTLFLSIYTTYLKPLLSAFQYRNASYRERKVTRVISVELPMTESRIRVSVQSIIHLIVNFDFIRIQVGTTSYSSIIIVVERIVTIVEYSRIMRVIGTRFQLMVALHESPKGPKELVKITHFKRRPCFSLRFPPSELRSLRALRGTSGTRNGGSLPPPFSSPVVLVRSVHLRLCHASLSLR